MGNYTDNRTIQTLQCSVQLYPPHKLLLVLCFTTFHPRPVDSNVTYIAPELQNNSCTPTQSPCYTLSQYRISSVQSSNMTFMFLPGNHHLSYQLSVANIHHLTFSALNDNVTVTIGCTLSGNLLQEAILEVHINNIDFNRCIMNQMLTISHLALIDLQFHKQGSSYYSTLELVNVNAIITNNIVTSLLKLLTLIIRVEH